MKIKIFQLRTKPEQAHWKTTEPLQILFYLEKSIYYLGRLIDKSF